MNRELNEALRELGLAAGATPREIERARRALAMAWHPDRFHRDPVRMRAAEEKLRRVNAAFRLLRDRGFDTGRAAPQSSRSSQSSRPSRAPFESSPRSSRRPVRRSGRGRKAAWWSAVFALMAFAYVTSNEGGRARALTSVSGYSAEDRSTIERARWDAGGLERWTRGNRLAAIEGIAAPHQPGESSSPPPSGRATPAPPAPFFTIGSSKEDVSAIQGAPRRFDGERWEYGYSYVEFDDDRVVRWYDSRREVLRARLVPTGPGPRLEYFTVDSTKDEVLRAQGSPRRFTDERWEYGYSYVVFEGDRVARWYDSRAHALRARLVPAAGVPTPEYFTVGSTRDEVLLLQGSPPRFTETRWEYGYSSITFDEQGRVVDWHDSGQRQLMALPR